MDSGSPQEKNAHFATCLMFIITVTPKHSTLFVPMTGHGSNKVSVSPPGFSCGNYFDIWAQSTSLLMGRVVFLLAAEEIDAFKFATNFGFMSTFAY